MNISNELYQEIKKGLLEIDSWVWDTDKKTALEQISNIVTFLLEDMRYENEEKNKQYCYGIHTKSSHVNHAGCHCSLDCLCKKKENK